MFSLSFSNIFANRFPSESDLVAGLSIGPSRVISRLVHESRMMALFRMIVLTVCQIMLTVRMTGLISQQKIHANK